MPQLSVWPQYLCEPPEIKLSVVAFDIHRIDC